MINSWPDFEQLVKLSGSLTARDASFSKRVFSGNPSRYINRLKAIGFHDLGCVLDAGCGFGQWSFALSELNNNVYSIDLDEDRVGFLCSLCVSTPSMHVCRADISRLPYPNNFFDGVFCYSSIYYSHVPRSVAEFARVLRPGGKLYICSNGPGWYLKNIIERPNQTPDFSPAKYGIRTFLDSILFRIMPITSNPDFVSLITSRNYLRRQMQRSGLTLIATGGEGTINFAGASISTESFFPGRYFGLEAVSEWLATKPKT